MQQVSISFCPACTCVAEGLVSSGYFPCSPLRPTTGFSINLLEVYVSQNPELTYAVALFCHGLIADLKYHGYHFSAQEPFQNQLPEAIIWFDALKYDAETLTKRLALVSNEGLQSVPFTITSFPVPPLPTVIPPKPSGTGTTLLLVHLRLCELCPACFGRSTWGGNVETCPDIHVAIDGNFTLVIMILFMRIRPSSQMPIVYFG